LLSIVKQLSGCPRTELFNRIRLNPTFKEITEIEINTLIDKFIELDYLENIDRELILGIEGENIVNSREFYSVFKTERTFKVYHKGQKIGDLQPNSQLKIDENIFLSARIWKIKDIDVQGFKITVIPAPDGKKPKFFGGGGNIHRQIREEMLRILKSNENYSELDDSSNEIIAEMRYDFKGFKVNDFKFDCPTIEKDGKLLIYTFTGSKINKSLAFLLSLTGIQPTFDDHSSSFELEIDISDFKNLVQEINIKYNQINDYLIEGLKENESLIGFSKWGEYLPLKYQAEIVKERYFDFKDTIELINNINLIENE